MKNQNLDLEKTLLEKAKQDKTAFNDLYKYFLNDVYRFSYSLVNNKENAEDITSKVFVEFYKKIDSFEWQNVSMKHWLFRATRNFAYENYREPQTQDFDEDIHIENEYEVSFVDEIMNKDLLEKVKEEVLKLSTGEQEVINLRIWEGLQFSEIAQIQGISEDTTKKRFYRSIEKVKKSLEKRNIKSIIALPILFTAILQAGALPAYAAPAALSTLTIGSLITTKTIMPTALTSIKAFLASKAGAAAIAATVVVGSAGTAGVYYANNKSKNKTSTPVVQNTPVPTTTSPTIAPSATPISVVESIKLVKYTDKENIYSISYPESWVIHTQYELGRNLPKDRGSYTYFTLPKNISATTPFYINKLDSSVSRLNCRANGIEKEPGVGFKVIDNITIGGQKTYDAYSINGFDATSTGGLDMSAPNTTYSYCVKTPSRDLRFEFTISKDGSNKELYEALSSVKFLEITPNLLKTYYYQELDLSFQYPSDWTIKLEKEQNEFPYCLERDFMKEYLKSDLVCLGGDATGALKVQNLILEGPNNASIKFWFATGIGYACDKDLNNDTCGSPYEKIKFLGKDLQLVKSRNNGIESYGTGPFLQIIPGPKSNWKSYLLTYKADLKEYSAGAQILKSFKYGREGTAQEMKFITIDGTQANSLEIVLPDSNFRMQKVDHTYRLPSKYADDLSSFYSYRIYNSKDVNDFNFIVGLPSESFRSHYLEVKDFKSTEFNLNTKKARVAANTWYYTSDVETDAQKCKPLSNPVEAPCGTKTLVSESNYEREYPYIMLCESTTALGLSKCDSIMEAIKVK